MMNSVRQCKRLLRIVYANTAVVTAAVTRHRKGCLPLLGIPVPKPLVLINEEDDDVDARTGEKDVDNDVMPVITIEDILNSPFVKTDVDDEYEGDE